jgi:hypothetical protein
LPPKTAKLLVFSLQQTGKPCFWEGEFKCTWGMKESGNLSQHLKESRKSLGSMGADPPKHDRKNIFFIRTKKSTDLKVV